MIQAELHNKCGNLSRSEDVLTSTVFGILQYREFSDILKDFLDCARNIHNGRRVTNLKLLNQNPEFKFWYRFKKNNKEIDLLISDKDEDKDEDNQIGIEVKYDSGESGEKQLSNYIDALDGAPLVFITMDYTKPPIGKEGNKRKNIFWLSWHNLYKLLNEYKDDSEGLKFELIKELMEYLVKRKIYYFQGFYFKSKISNVSRLDNSFWNNNFFENKNNIEQIKKPVFWEEKYGQK